VAKEFTAKEVIDLYKQGYTNVEVAEHLEMTKRQFAQLCQTNPAFRELVERGNDIAESWNMRQGRMNLENKDFNTTLYKARMGHLYGWADKIDQNTKQLSVSAEVSKEELIKRIQAYMPELLPKAIEGEVVKDDE
jgi:hypothetical protein